MEHINRVLVHTTNHLLEESQGKLVVTVETKYILAAYKSRSAPSCKMKATILFHGEQDGSVYRLNCLNENRMSVIR